MESKRSEEKKNSYKNVQAKNRKQVRNRITETENSCEEESPR